MTERPDGGRTRDDDDATVRPEQFEWVCQECERGHPKHSPPCSRCGHMNLEKEPIRYDLDDAEAPSYLEVGKWHVAVIVVLVGLVGLVAAGVISVPEFGGNPSIDDAPGEGERASGIDLEASESQIRDELNAYREENGKPPLESDGDLSGVAQYHNRHHAVAEHDADVPTPSAREDFEAFDYRCPRNPALQSVPVAILGVDGSIDAYDSESELAEAVSDGLVRGQSGDTSWLAYWDAVGVDLHVYPDGNVYVAIAVC